MTSPDIRPRCRHNPPATAAPSNRLTLTAPTAIHTTIHTTTTTSTTTSTRMSTHPSTHTSTQSKPRVAVVSCARTDIAMTDNPPLIAALSARGINADLVVWDDPALDRDDAWSMYDLAVIRTTWDYFDKLGAFRAWLPRVAAQTEIANDASIIAWNLDKRYLPQLEREGVAIVPTRIAGPDVLDDTVEAMQRLHGPVAVKPSVGGGAKGLRLLAPGERVADRDRLDVLGPAGTAMVQPVIESVRTEGEMALVWIDDDPAADPGTSTGTNPGTDPGTTTGTRTGGSVRYAVQKVPKPGDIRVQPEWGATYHPVPFTEAQEALARAAVAACEKLVARPLYARVDMVRMPDDTWALMELEVIEPEIFFAVIPGSADHLADAIAQHPAINKHPAITKPAPRA